MTGIIDPGIWLQSIVNGLLMGGVYALVGLGMTLIRGVMKITNFAQGEFLMLGMYATFWLFSLGQLDPYLAAPLAAAALLLLGMLIQRYLIGPVLNAEGMNQIMLTMGISTFLYSAAQVLWRADNRSVAVPYAAISWTVGPVVLNLPRTAAFAVSMLLALGLFLFLKYSRVGQAMRAASQNRSAALLMGINVRQIYVLAFGIGAALAGIAGALITPFLYVNPLVGQQFALTTFVVVVLGTMGHFVGALVSGLIVGVAEALGGLVFGPQMKQLVFLLIFILVLMFKPTGLFGGNER